MGVGPNDNIPASAPITTIGTSAGNIFFTPETDAAVSSRSGFYQDPDSIDESHRDRREASRLIGSVDADLLAAFVLTLKLDDPVNLCEQGEVFPQSDVYSRVEFGSTLPDEDVPGPNGLTRESLDAPPLGVAVPAVIGTSTSFFMSHF